MEQTFKHLVALTGLSAQDYQILQSTANKTRPWANEIVKAFYDILFNYAPTAHVFKTGERPERETVLHTWYLKITGGTLDRQFWRRIWLVGSVHIDRGVTNPLMLGMMSQIQQRFLHKCLQTFEVQQAEQVYGAFKRITDIVAALIAESYLTSHRIEAIEKAKTKKRMEHSLLLWNQLIKPRDLDEDNHEARIEAPH
jgi:hypothetical protein